MGVTEGWCPRCGRWFPITGNYLPRHSRYNPKTKKATKCPGSSQRPGRYRP